MTSFYNFVSGPLAWAAWAIFICGSIYRIVSMIKLAKEKDVSSIAYMSWSKGLRSIVNWLIPFRALGWKENPAVTVFTFIFHICFIGLALFLSSHSVLWDYAFGVNVWHMSDPVADVLTVGAIAACGFFAYRRFTNPVVRFVSRPEDWAILALLAALFVTGFMATHLIGDNLIMSLLHVLCGEAVLVAIPFTRLSHALFFPITRAYMGSEFGGVRHCNDW